MSDQSYYDNQEPLPYYGPFLGQGDDGRSNNGNEQPGQPQVGGRRKTKDQRYPVSDPNQVWSNEQGTTFVMADSAIEAQNEEYARRANLHAARQELSYRVHMAGAQQRSKTWLILVAVLAVGCLGSITIVSVLNSLSPLH